MARPRQISDDRILEVAREVFLTSGPTVSTTAIADKLGISQSVLFQRFGTKERLLVAALSPDRRTEWVDVLRRGPDPREIAVQLFEIAQAFSGYFRAIMPALTVLRQAGLDLDDLSPTGELPAPLAVHRELARWFRRAQSQGRLRRGDPTAMALAFQGALQIQPCLAQVAVSPVDDIGELAYLRSVVETFWWGLSAESERADLVRDDEEARPGARG